MLISSIIGIDSRTTMDMDTTIKGFVLDKEHLIQILNEIIKMDIDDKINFGNGMDLQNMFIGVHAM